MVGPAEQLREPLRRPGFRLFWLASTSGFLGIAVTAMAIDVLVVQALGANEVEVGVVKAAQFIPYLVMGLVAGVLVDRWRRKPTLVIAHAAQGFLLLLLPLLWWLGVANVWTVALVLVAAGTLGVVSAAAEQSILVDLVARGELVGANARLGQSMTVAQSAGPPLAGLIIGLLGVGSALTTGAVARILAAVMISRVRVAERNERGGDRRPLLADLGTGLRFIYRHRTLGPLAISTHVWFLANSTALTVVALFALRDLGVSGAAYGIVLAAVGIGGFSGALVAPRVGRRMGAGNSIIASRALCAGAWLVTLATPAVAHPLTTAAYLCVGMFFYGLAMGVEDPNEMGYWQAVTPWELLGRVNASRRTVNRSVAVVGSLLGGSLVGAVGSRMTLVIVVGLFVSAAVIAALSPLRGVSVADSR
ncbi:MAG: MFS transporter [Propionibacteriaceae bacterium]|nr:MFS transporter [Propionibacteriaceae bacterium]